MLTYTKTDAKERVKLLQPAFSNYDATIFNALFDDALKLAQTELWDELIAADDPFVKGTTLTEATAPSTGTEKINTTAYDVFIVSILATADKILDDTLLIFNATTANFKRVPRLDIDSMVAGGASETVLAFYETKGKIIIWMKQGELTVPADFHYNYLRVPTMPAVDGDPLDIPQTSFGTICSKIVSFMQA